MARRIVEVVELCEHGARDPHIVNVNQLQHEYECVPERRVLTPGSYVLIERESDGSWPESRLDISFKDALMDSLAGDDS